MSIKCPSCGVKSPTIIGKIPTAYVFAGAMLSEPLDGGDLHKCNACYLLFRYPRLDKEYLDLLYKSGKADNWSSLVGGRNDWKIAIEFIDSKVLNKSILDIGCFDGQFLDALSDKNQVFGIEVHDGAIQRAENKGIQIIGNNFSDIRDVRKKFDVVTAFDVIEHTEDPVLFIKDILGLVSKGGYVIISTGNTMAWIWRFMKGRYGYCANAEHISFINPMWTVKMAKDMDLEILEQVMFFHGKSTLMTKLKQIPLYLVYYFMPSLLAKLRYHGYGGVKTRSLDTYDCPPPSSSFSKDHFLTIFRKK